MTKTISKKELKQIVGGSSGLKGDKPRAQRKLVEDETPIRPETGG
ncbi:bacteriocin [Pseudoalteromonas rubra]|nr:bacteriocin [Pseudoalteromonas rubra]MEC4091626.1 bacteriocin [Pseudoalteromonas rubra]